MPGEIPGNFDPLASGSLQNHLVGVGQLQARDALAGLDLGNFAARYETPMPVGEAQFNPSSNRLAVVIIRLAFFTSTTSIGYLSWRASHVVLISAACLP